MHINKILPPQTRTIFVQIYSTFLEKQNADGRLVYKTSHTYENPTDKFYPQIKNYKTIKPLNAKPELIIFKFKINIPKMMLNGILEPNPDKNFIQFFPLNENNKQCYSPLLNTGLYGNICLNDVKDTDSENEIINKIYNSPFNLERTSSVWKYANKINTYFPYESQRISYNTLQFYQNWQDSGEINLIQANQYDQFIKSPEK